MDETKEATEQLPDLPDLPELRITGIYGEVTEEKCFEVISSMLHLKDIGTDQHKKGSEIVLTYEPFEFIVSTEGGGASDMFAVYDMMRLIREDCDIETLGIGKVMSAGVLLLAAGTKGKRRIGKNCRVMIHPVKAGHAGYVHEMQNELVEVKWIQARYTECLVSETNMTIQDIKKILNKKVNVYISAEEAVQLGIADKIV